MSGIKDVAKKAGVSISTVSNVLNKSKYVSPDLVMRVEKAVEELSYNEELSRKCDEMALVMLINKIQTPEDYEEFRKVSEELINSIYGNASEEIKEIYQNILWSLLMKMNVPSEEARELMGEIGGRGMGYLFENMEKMDIQAERRNTQREKIRADEASKRAEKAENEKKQMELEIQQLKQELERMKKKI